MRYEIYIVLFNYIKIFTIQKIQIDLSYFFQGIIHVPERKYFLELWPWIHANYVLCLRMVSAL